ncbi:MAG: elongation factor P [Candidatus Eisenbacteria bacterium]
MATTADIRNGLVIDFKDDLYKIVDFQHVKPGKGGAFVRAKLKNIRTGRVIDNTWNAGSTINPVRMRHKQIQYLYSTGDDYHFMDNETYEQLELPKAMIEPYLPYLLENMEMQVLVKEEDEMPVDLDFPATVVLEVTEAYDAARGDTAGAVTKEVTVETGLQLQVPPFIKQGEKIRIDTSTGKYMERA